MHVLEKAARVASQFSQMQFHVVRIAHLEHQLSVVVLGEEVVVGLGQFYFNFELN